jgi:hypothetical protein
MQAYEGYLEKGNIYPIAPLKGIPGRRRVIITVLDEPTREKADTVRAKEAAKEDKELRMAWLNQLHKAVDASMGEDLPDLPPRQPMRAPLDFGN